MRTFPVAIVLVLAVVPVSSYSATIATTASLSASGFGSFCSIMENGTNFAEALPAQSCGPLQASFSRASAAFGELSLSGMVSGAVPINQVFGSASFSDSITFAGSGLGFVRYRFSGDLSVANTYVLSLGWSATLGRESLGFSLPPNFPLSTYSTSVDYWTDAVAFEFGLPTPVSTSISYGLGGSQEYGTLSASFRLREIAVYDDQGVFLGSVRFMSDSGTLYSLASSAPALVPEPATGGYALAALATALWAGRRRQRRA